MSGELDLAHAACAEGLAQGVVSENPVGPGSAGRAAMLVSVSPALPVFVRGLLRRPVSRLRTRCGIAVVDDDGWVGRECLGGHGYRPWAVCVGGGASRDSGRDGCAGVVGCWRELLLLCLCDGHLELVSSDHTPMRRRYLACLLWDLVELRCESRWVARHRVFRVQ